MDKHNTSQRSGLYKTLIASGYSEQEALLYIEQKGKCQGVYTSVQRTLLDKLNGHVTRKLDSD